MENFQPQLKDNAQKLRDKPFKSEILYRVFSMTDSSQNIHKKLINTGKKQTFDSYYAKIDSDYKNRTGSKYHMHRLEILSKSIKRMGLEDGDKVIDFGCGDGLFTSVLSEFGYNVVGVDPSETLIEAAKEKCPNIDFILGSIDALKKEDAGSVDAITAFDVIDYLTAEEEASFFKEAHRVLSPKGKLLTSRSNELFDLYTFNRYTVSFFQDHFGEDISDLIKNPDKPVRSQENIRANPLSYPQRLSTLGFQELDQIFLMYHPKPPLKMDGFDPDALDKREFVDTLAFPEDQKWKLNLQCSVYCSISEKA